MNTCQTTTNNNLNLCACVWEKIEYKYNFEDYSEIQETMKAGKPPPQEFLFFLGDAKGMCARDFPMEAPRPTS